MVVATVFVNTQSFKIEKKVPFQSVVKPTKLFSDQNYFCLIISIGEKTKKNISNMETFYFLSMITIEICFVKIPSHVIKGKMHHHFHGSSYRICKYSLNLSRLEKKYEMSVLLIKF